MKEYKIFICICLFIFFSAFIYNASNYIRGYKLNYGIGLKVCEATMTKEPDFSDLSNHPTEFSYKQINKGDKLTVLQFAYHDR